MQDNLSHTVLNYLLHFKLCCIFVTRKIRFFGIVKYFKTVLHSKNVMIKN